MTSPPLASVRVHASTSNLGPGFDVLGVLLSLPLDVAVLEPAERHELVDAAGEARTWPTGADNLLLRAFDLVRGPEARGGYRFTARSQVPVARGLGSSGAAIAAGLLLAATVARDPRPRVELLRLGLALEGHPDNLAPALFGGARLCVPRVDPHPPHLVKQPVHPSIGWVVAWPDVPIPTEAARAALPAAVPFADAAENPRRLALLLEGLRTGDPDLLADGVQDRLHEQHRLALLPGSGRVLDAAREAGAWAATLSGSGSAHVALASRERTGVVAEAMANAWRTVTGTGTARVVDVVLDAPRVTVG